MRSVSRCAFSAGVSRAMTIVVALLVSVPVAWSHGAQDAPSDGDDRAPTLRIGTKSAPPFAFRDEAGEWTGISIELWRDIAEARDYSYEFVEESLEGLVDGLASGELDASVAALTVTADRVSRVDFTHPFYTSGLGIALPRSERAPTWLAVLRGVFSWRFLQGVLALAALLFVVGVVVWLVERRKNKEQFGGSTLQGIGAGFWYSAVTMTTVGYGDKTPVTKAGRFVGLIWMFASVITISGFTAAIASTLTVEGLAHGIRGPGDLPGNVVATLADSTSESYLLQNGIATRVYGTVEEAFEGVASGEVDAMVYDAPLLRYLVSTSPARDVIVLSGTFQRQDYAIALPLNSNLRKPINQTLLQSLQEPTWDEHLTRFMGSEQ